MAVEKIGKEFINVVDGYGAYCVRLSIIDVLDWEAESSSYKIVTQRGEIEPLYQKAGESLTDFQLIVKALEGCKV